MSEIDESTDDQEIMRMVELGRRSHGTPFCANVYYQAVLNACAGLKTPVQRLAAGEACAWTATRALEEGMIGTAYDWFRRALAADPLCTEYREALADAKALLDAAQAPTP